MRKQIIPIRFSCQTRIKLKCYFFILISKKHLSLIFVTDFISNFAHEKERVTKR